MPPKGKQLIYIKPHIDPNQPVDNPVDNLWITRKNTDKSIVYHKYPNEVNRGKRPLTVL